MPNFAFYKPKSLDEAIGILRVGKGLALAGGTDLLVRLKKGQFDVPGVVNLKQIVELSNITLQDDGGLAIGALAKISELAENQVIRENYPLLFQALVSMASPQIRNRATIGGNLCNASPAADTAPPLIALGAKVTLNGISGSRTVDVEDFFQGPGKTILEQGELLTSIRLPAPSVWSGGMFLKHGNRKALEISIASAAVQVTLIEDGTKIKEARLALGSVAPVPFRVRVAEKALNGIEITADFSEVGDIVAKEIKPIDDVRGSAAYRYQIAGTLVRRAIQGAIAAAQAKGGAKN